MEILKDVNKHFNSGDDYCTNQQLIGCNDMFVGTIVKDWVIDNRNSINIHPCDKVLIENCVKNYHYSWKRRCVALHIPDVQENVLK